MTSWSGRAVVGILAISLTAACCESASAQGRGGRGGRGGFGMFGRNIHQIDLATLPEVQEELALTDEQKTKVADLNDEFREERRALGGGGGGGGGGRGGFSPEAMAERAALNAEFASQLNEALEEAQQKRIGELYVQANGTAALSDEAIVAALMLTDEQKEELDDVRQDNREAMQDAFDPDASREEQMATMEELRKENDEALLAVLTDEQRKAWDEMKGETLEMDLSSLQRRGGRGGRGGGGGGRGGDGGGRPADDGA
jgi:Spy/CpxP family protein refolding chaperone